MSGDIDTCSFLGYTPQNNNKGHQKGDFSSSEFFKGEGGYWTCNILFGCVPPKNVVFFLLLALV